MKPAKQCQNNKTLKREGACPVYLYKDVTYTSARRLPRGCGRSCRKSSTIQSNRKRERITIAVENAKSWLSFMFTFGWDLHLFSLSHAMQTAFSLYVGSTSKDSKSAGDVMGHKCATRMQHTIEMSTPMTAHMPCHHHQETHKQDTTHTPPKAPLKCHRNTCKIPLKRNITNACLPTATKTHLRNRD